MHRLILNDGNRAEAVAATCDVLGHGALVGLPTETVYGLAADAANGEAVARVFAAKGRPRFNPLICHVADLAMARRYGRLDDTATRLAAAFWPGPLTLVVPLAESAPVHPLVTAGLPSIAVRSPRGIAGAVIAAFGRALAAPSANRSGRVSATRAEHVAEQLGEKVALILDAGPCAVGLESTIVSLVGREPTLLRPGGLPAETIEAELGAELARASAGDPVSAPGMLASHYAPKLPVRLSALTVDSDEALLAFGPTAVPGGAHARAILNLSPGGDLVAAAANLFDFLTRLDRSGATRIAVAPIPATGLGEAINDRLRRAAAPRA